MSLEDEPLDGVTESVKPPEWATRVAEKDPKPISLIPSSLSGPDADAAFDQGAPVAISPLAQMRRNRFRRGTLIHGLLEFLPSLPAADRETGAETYLTATAADIGEPLRSELATEALGVINAPEFAPFLGPEAQAEVPFSAIIKGPDQAAITISGQVDRLALIGSTLHILDYKTHRPAAQTLDDVPAGILRQMALYRAALIRIFPAEIVNVSILWTNHASLMALPPALLDQALAEALAGAPTA